MKPDIGKKEFEFLSLLFRKSKGEVLSRLRKCKDATRSGSFNVLQEVIFKNCTALTRDTSSTSCFCVTEAEADPEFVECIAELVRKGILQSLFKTCEARIEQLPDPKKQPDEFADEAFRLFFHCAKITSGQFCLNPNSGKKFMHTTELAVNSTSSSSTPSEDKYCGDDSASDKSPKCKKMASSQAAKNFKRKRKRALAQASAKISIPVVKKEEVIQIPPRPEDRAYLADIESSGGGGTPKMDLDKWAAIYRMLKEDLRKEMEQNTHKMTHSTPKTISTHPKSILKQPSVSLRAPQQIAPRAPPRLKPRLTPTRPLSTHATILQQLPAELMSNLKQTKGAKTKPASLRSEQIKIVLARNEEQEKNRIHNIELSRQKREARRLAAIEVSKRSDELQRKTKSQSSREVRSEMARVKRQFLQEQQNKSLQMKGIIQTT